MKKYFKLKNLLLVTLANLCFTCLNAQSKKTSDMSVAEITRKVQEKKDNHDRVTRNLRKPHENNKPKQFGNPRTNENISPQGPPEKPVIKKQSPTSNNTRPLKQTKIPTEHPM